MEGDHITAYFHRVTKIKHELKSVSLSNHKDRNPSESKEIIDCTVNYFQTLFSTNLVLLQDMSMVDDTVPRLVDDNMNVILTRLPSLDEIIVVVFALNKDSALGPDDFGVIFYKYYWDIIMVDISNDVTDYFFLWLDSSWF